MIGALSAIGSIFSFLGAALKGLFTLIVFRQGEKAQQAEDLKATNAADVKAKEIDDTPTDTAARDAYLAQRMHHPRDGQ